MGHNLLSNGCNSKTVGYKDRIKQVMRGGHFFLTEHVQVFFFFEHLSTALVAQLVARRSDKAKVIGSSPVESTFPV